MKKLILSLFLLAGCAGTQPYKVQEEPIVRVPTIVHVINYYDHNHTANKLINHVNQTLEGAIQLDPVLFFIDKSLPTTIEKHSQELALSNKSPDGYLHIYIVLKIGRETPKGYSQVNGVMVEHLNQCHRVIVISSSRHKYDTLLHEVGHLFGLEHSHVKNNTMSLDRENHTHLNFKQIQTMINRAIIFNRNCWYDKHKER